MLVRARTSLRLAATLLAASALQACANNPLAVIDGPYVPPSQRAAAATMPTTAAETAAEPVAQAVVPPPAPLPVSLPEPPARPIAEQVPPEDLAWPDETFVGPVLTAPEMEELASAPSARRLPADAPLPPLFEPGSPQAASQFEALPEDEPEPMPGGSPYRDFQTFVIARLGQSGARESMLLADPPSLDPALRSCRGLPSAVLVDLDPAGALVPMLGQPQASPELAAILGSFRQRGITIYWITAHGPGQASALRERLAASGLDPAGNDQLIVSRFAGESKQVRRQALGETDCLLAIMGDQLGDFDELYDYVLDLSVAVPLERHIGNGWFLAPPPLQLAQTQQEMPR